MLPNFPQLLKQNPEFFTLSNADLHLKLLNKNDIPQRFKILTFVGIKPKAPIESKFIRHT